MANTRSVTSTPFGQLPDGRAVTQFILTNHHGVEARLINYGGIITHLKTPDRTGQLGDIVLGFDTLEPYLNNGAYLGALIGRFGNRIAGGRFELDGQTYTLACNDGNNHLHGGLEGFDKKLWQAEAQKADDSVSVKLVLISPDGDQGYPGQLTVTVTYTLTDDNELITDFHAVTDKTTPVNLTQHSYFNLAGEGDILQHQLWLDADHYTPVDSGLIPLGEQESVEDTPFDFRTARTIGERIDAANTQLAHAGGYDHNLVLNHPGTDSAARVVEPTTGRVLELATEEPCIQFYAGNFLDGTLQGKGRRYTKRSGLCLEPQHVPDSPNQPQFPSTLLHPGEEYKTSIRYRFSTTD